MIRKVCMSNSSLKHFQRSNQILIRKQKIYNFNVKILFHFKIFYKMKGAVIFLMQNSVGQTN